MKNRTTIYLDENLKKDLQIFAIEHKVSITKLISDVTDYFVHDIVQYAGDYPKGGYNDTSN